MHPYVHGYSEREGTRLSDQAGCLADLLHHDTVFPDGARVLEAGCGVGAQTRIIAARNPNVCFVSVDISPDSVEVARRSVRELGLGNVEFGAADIFRLPYAEGEFDHALACFVLEHLSDPVRALECLRRVIRPGGTVTVIEGDHGSAYFYPDDLAARRVIDCQVRLQAQSGGNAKIGRELRHLLCEAGFGKIAVAARQVYVDADRPGLVEGFTKNTFTAMIEGVRDAALAKGLASAEQFDAGVAALSRTTGTDGSFCYTFFKGTAVREA